MSARIGSTLVVSRSKVTRACWWSCRRKSSNFAGVSTVEYATSHAAAGALEYLVLNLRDSRLHWFDLKANQELTADPDGIIRVRVFPGLWIDPAAVVARDLRALLATLDKGLASADHAAFVAELVAAKAP